jgi:low affinity Fe/Cu permease
VVNTATTIVTFLMVFLIQNTQNRDSLAVHLKLDEVIRALAEADDGVMDAEDRTDAELAELKANYAALCADHAEVEQQVEIGAGAAR